MEWVMVAYKAAIARASYPEAVPANNEKAVPENRGGFESVAMLVRARLSSARG
jgi:hypothetical protein